MTKRSGVILAGGLNRRMGGQSKALLKYEGRTFLARQLTELGSACSELILVTQEPERYEEELRTVDVVHHIRVIPDLQPGKGPLAGLQAAMGAAANDELWVVGCDMPSVSSRAAEAMSRLRRDLDGDAVIARLHGRLHPLHGLYHRRCLQTVERLLAEEDYRMMRLIGELHVQEVDDSFFERQGIPTDFTRNINNPDEYNKLLNLGSRYFLWDNDSKPN
ncbi:molybdenum cofactor guanylyltransferase [Paenibacillus sp. PvR098]|uniref:molybdenum cofactor guanylyltransferase n=1 Tax=unclassified Paenibacillus TaxID=185978 RepID=UPI001B6B00C5|nr:molybdopterin-guanine dinucleotide biosynthesis protein A [Paenibacillus sp. PvP091]MBP1172164.1 molybdopterin-guanine dinucleotide biosynthesis protein A [Paenibacillus sp. PvR098]MBP2438545.1 molybdopterin-guanine dinucleotide biosynthesis protein A [Paenibacillus sp. PvP052]